MSNTVITSVSQLMDVSDGPTASDGVGKQDAALMEDTKKFEKLSASRLFFVRLPRPAELSSTSEYDKQKDLVDEKLRDVSDELQPIMAERSRNAGHLAEAREAVRELKAQIDDKELTLNPYQQERKAAIQDRETQRRTREEQRTAERKAREEQYRAEVTAKQKIRNDFIGQYGHLGVNNEDEIDEKIQALEFSQQHESLSIAEEKALLKKIRQLQDSRSAVRSYSQWAADDKAEREAKADQAKKRKEDKDRLPSQPKARAERSTTVTPEDAQREEMEELRHIVNGLWEDYKLQLEIRNKHQTIEASLKQTIEALFVKRDTLRKEREEVWAKIQKHRDSIKSANKPFSENRSFSAQVREAVKQGRVEVARQLCAVQSFKVLADTFNTTEMMEKYARDSAFRKEYNKLWDAAVDYQRPAATASDSHQSAAASVIAEALEAARRSVASKQANKAREAEAKPLESAKPKPKPEEVATATAPVTAFPVSKPTTIPGMEPSDKPRPKPKKDKKASKAAAVELPVVDDTPFVPPVTLRDRSVAAQSAEELKEQERAHNRAAAAEAAQRKERRRLAQEKKKQKAQQRAELMPAQAVREEAAEEVTAPETPPAEEVKAAPPSLPTASGEDTGKLKNRSKPSNFKTRTAPRPRPSVGKKSLYGLAKTYGKQLYSTAEQHPLAVGVSGLAAALVLALGPALYFYT